MITIKQYQDFCNIPSGTTDMELSREMVKLLNLDPNLTYDEIQKKVKEWLSKIIVSRKKHNYIRMGKKWYKVDRDLYTLTFSQWIYFDDTMRGADPENTSKILHFMIATFLRECRFYKFFPKKFDVMNIEKTSKIIQNNLDVCVALELVNFFFHYTLSSMKNTQIDYLEKLEKIVTQGNLKD